MDIQNRFYITIGNKPNCIYSLDETCATSTHTSQFKMIEYEDFYKIKKGMKQNKKFNFLSNNDNDVVQLKSGLKDAYESIINKVDVAEKTELIKECFELGCYVLYDRQILREVIEKQKQYEVEYIIDFFRYVLRIFFRQYSSENILTRNQCTDLKKLCENMTKLNETHDVYNQLIRKSSGKELADYLHDILMEKGLY